MKIAAGKKRAVYGEKGAWREHTLKTRNAARKEQSLQVRTAVVAQGAEGACHAAGQATLGHVPSSSLLSFYFTLLLLLLLSQVACYIIHTSLMATCAHVDLPPSSLLLLCCSRSCCCCCCCFCRQSVFVACLRARVILATSHAISFYCSLLWPVLLSLRKQIAALIAFLINCKYCGGCPSQTICCLSWPLPCTVPPPPLPVRVMFVLTLR